MAQPHVEARKKILAALDEYLTYLGEVKEKEETPVVETKTAEQLEAEARIAEGSADLAQHLNLGDEEPVIQSQDVSDIKTAVTGSGVIYQAFEKNMQFAAKLKGADAEVTVAGLMVMFPSDDFLATLAEQIDIVKGYFSSEFKLFKEFAEQRKVDLTQATIAMQSYLQLEYLKEILNTPGAIVKPDQQKNLTLYQEVMKHNDAMWMARIKKDLTEELKQSLDLLPDNAEEDEVVKSKLAKDNDFSKLYNNPLTKEILEKNRDSLGMKVLKVIGMIFASLTLVGAAIVAGVARYRTGSWLGVRGSGMENKVDAALKDVSNVVPVMKA